MKRLKNIEIFFLPYTRDSKNRKFYLLGMEHLNTGYSKKLDYYFLNPPSNLLKTIKLCGINSD